MPQPGESGWAHTAERVLPDCDESGTLSDLFDSDLAHLFDYCRALLGQDAEAIRTARSVLDSPHDPLADRERLRAWHFGLTRSLALALRPPGSDGPSYRPHALIAGSDQQAEGGVLRPFHALTDRDREILDLVYRHRIRPADLPAVLIAPAEEAYRRLVNAEAEFVSLATGPNNGPGADLEDIAALPLAALPRAALPLAALPLAALPLAALPLAALPAAEQGEHQPGDPPACQLEEPAPRPPASRRRLLVLGAAIVAIAAILGGVVLFAVPGHPAASSGAADLPRGGASQAIQRAGVKGAAHAGRSAQSVHRPVTGQSASPGPVASRPVTLAPSPPSSPFSPVIAGLTVTVQPVPCLAGTKANFRWHYTASGSPGGWSGTTTKACPGSLTMGPQAMGANLQVTPGTVLQAGYDFTLPGNNKSLTMTVSAAQVTFAISCAPKTAPSAPTITVALLAQTYSISGSQWYPSGDQSSPLVYQGSILVPALCGPGGKISLAKGGTFSATLG